MRVRLSKKAAAVGALVVLCLAGVGAASAAQHAAPNNLQITPGVSSLSTSWGVTTTSGLAGFRVRWRPIVKPRRPWGKPVDLGASARSYAITGLSAGSYEVRVRAFVGATRRNGAGHKKAKRLSGLTSGVATVPGGGEEPPQEKEEPKEEPKEEEPEEEPPSEEEPPGSGCALYGSPSGNDSNKGTQAAPLQTIHALLGRLKAGQTGCLAQGTYAGLSVRSGESHGGAGAPVTITSTNPQAPATISGRMVTDPGADWLTFSHLILTDSEVRYPSISIGSKHTSWIADDVSAPQTICFELSGPGAYGPAEDTLIEGSRIHNCGQPFLCDTDSEPCNQPPNDGYFIHGIYDMGTNTTVRGNYIYEASSKGVLLRNGSGAIVEHNVIDSNGSGIAFGDLGPAKDTVQWNIVTNSGGPCKSCFDYFGIWSGGAIGAGNVVRNNDVFGNDSGNLGDLRKLTLQENIEVDPQYVNAAKHDYTLQPDSPVLAYGPQ